MKFKSQVYTEASGSVGGLTYSHNRGGMYTRGRTIPTNPNSPQQQAVRGFVATLTSTWLNVLTAAERTQWDAYAAQVPLLDRLGEPRNVGGLAMYVRSNVPRLQAGLARVDPGAFPFNLGEFTNPSFGNCLAATDVFDVTFDNSDDWANENGAAMTVLASRPQNPSINYFKGPYRYAGLIAGDAITPPTSPATITLPFGVEIGQRIFVMIRVTRVDGRLALPFRGFCLAS